jgi:hypothetical protein
MIIQAILVITKDYDINWEIVFWCSSKIETGNRISKHILSLLVIQEETVFRSSEG